MHLYTLKQVANVLRELEPSGQGHDRRSFHTNVRESVLWRSSKQAGMEAVLAISFVGLRDLVATVRLGFAFGLASFDRIKDGTKNFVVSLCVADTIQAFFASDENSPLRDRHRGVDGLSN